MVVVENKVYDVTLNLTYNELTLIRYALELFLENIDVNEPGIYIDPTEDLDSLKSVISQMINNLKDVNIYR